MLSVPRTVAIPSHKAIHCKGDALISIPISCLFNLKYSIWLRRLCLLSAGISFGYNCRVLCTFVLNSWFRTTGVAFWQHQTVSRSQEQEEAAEINTRFACRVSRNSLFNVSGFRVGFCSNDSQPGSTAVLDDAFVPTFRRNKPTTYLNQIQSP